MLKVTDLPVTVGFKIELTGWDMRSLNGTTQQYIEMKSLDCKYAMGRELVKALLDLEATRTTERLDVRVWEERTDLPHGGLALHWQAKIEKVPNGDVYFYEVPRKTGIDPDKCVKCGTCAELCPQDAITIGSTK